MSTATLNRDMMTDVDAELFDILGPDLFTTAPLGFDERHGGYQTEGDIVYVTDDGIDLNDLWEEAQQVVGVWNQARGRLVDLLTYQVTNEIETVPQVGEASFEEASEFGEPQAARVKLGIFQLGFDFRDYDVATRFTWKFLRDADARNVRAVHNAILAADEKLVFRKVLEAIFDNRNRETDIRNNPYKVYPLYNGDGTVPPSYREQEFDGNHTHYVVSGNANLIDSGDLENAQEHIEEHGYSVANGTTFIHLVNREQLKEIRKFRMGQVNNNGVTANYDFIPSNNNPAMFLDSPLGLLGNLPPDMYKGLRVAGTYGDALVIEEPFVPAKYMLTIGSGGVGNLANLVGFREHKNPVYRGLRLLPGNDRAYPLVESYYSRGFGTGIRQRAGAVVTQIKAPGAYDIPAKYKKTVNQLVA